MKSLAFKIPPPSPPELNERPIFNESRLKLYWARKHAHQISADWEAWFQIHNDPVKRRELQRRNGTNYPAYHIPVPINIPLTLGDCLRCMRSSMDYLVCSLARASDLPDDSILFPFNEKRESLVASFREAALSDGKKRGRRAGALHELSRKYPDLQGVILDVIQPYSADYGAGAKGDLLWRIINADNVDKHRLISPTVSPSEIKGELKFPGGGSMSDFRVIGAPIRMRGDTEIQGEADISVDILFEEPTRLAGKPITRTLVEACDFASEIVEIFESHF